MSSTPSSSPTGGSPSGGASNSARPVFLAVLKYGGILAVGIAVVGGVLGFVFDGWTGVLSVLIGTVMAVVFLGLTAASILIANRYQGTPFFTAIFFGVVLGAWIAKFVIFLVLVIVLKDQPWINPLALFLSIVAGVIGSLVVDVVVLLRSRVGYVSDARMPGE
jgi:hypothetical protein